MKSKLFFRSSVAKIASSLKHFIILLQLYDYKVIMGWIVRYVSDLVFMLNTPVIVKRKLAIAFLLAIFIPSNASATDYFVAIGGNDANTGLSWTTPYLTVTKALSVAAGTGVNNRIFVKEGVYNMNATAYTFTNSSFDLQGGFPTSATGTDISGYSQANTTTLKYNLNLTIAINGTVVINNTGAGSYAVSMKGFTVSRLGLSGYSYSSFFVAKAVNTANTAFAISDMTHVSGLLSSEVFYEGVNSLYDFENILAGNSISFTNVFVGDIRVFGNAFGAITVRNSAVAPTFTTCTFNGCANEGTSGIIFLENISASPIANVAIDNKFINSGGSATRYVNHFVLFKNSGDFIIDGLSTPVDNNRAGSSLPGSFIRAWGSVNGAVISPTSTLNAGKTIVRNCTFTNTTEGGAICIYSFGGRGEIEISNNTFTNNSSTSAYGGGAIMILGVDTAVLSNYPTVKIFGNNFTDNKNVPNLGGAIAIVGIGIVRKYGIIDIYNNSFTGNLANKGGAISMSQGNATNLKITNNTFANNTGSAQGGAISSFLFDAPHNITGNSFCGNRVTTGDGGAIYAYNTNTIIDYPLNISDCVFYDNRASHGGAINVGIKFPSVHIKTSTFAQNSATNTSNAIYLQGIAKASDIDSCVFVKNVGVGTTVNLNAVGSPFSITKSNFTANTSSGNQSGAITLNPSVNTVNIEDCIFDVNSSKGQAGAINFGINTVATLATIKKCVFKNNFLGDNPLDVTGVGSDINLATYQPLVTNSYLQSPLLTTNYTTANIATLAGNNATGNSTLFAETTSNGCSAVPLVYILDVPAVATIDCSKTQISPAPIFGTPSQLDLIVTIDVTAVGTFTPVTVSGSGMTLVNNPTSISATTTGTQQFHIPVLYDGTALGTLNFQIGILTPCTANLTLTPKTVMSSIWTLDNCSSVLAGPVLK